jgi:3-oxoadipate enol-lactonase
MPFVHTANLRTYYRLEGNGGRPVLMFAHSLGVDHGQWDPQVPEFLPHFQILRYDIRGHGATDAPPGDYTMDLLARDALALADALGIRRFAFCGLSLGGMIGQWLGANAGDRFTHLALANTSPRFADSGPMEQRRQTVIREGMGAVAGAVMGRFFTPEALASGSPAVATIRHTLLATDPVGYAGCCAAVRDMDQTGLLRRIRVPTLIIGGNRDVSTPWAGNGEVLAASILGAKTVLLAAAHLSNVECPREFSAALLDFLAEA